MSLGNAVLRQSAHLKRSAAIGAYTLLGHARMLKQRPTDVHGAVAQMVSATYQGLVARNSGADHSVTDNS
jgi:hypothetical protein